jgi:hypothetical protein
MIVVQKNNYGAKPIKTKSQLTASASYTRKLVSGLNAEGIPADDSAKKESSSSEKSASGEKSTETYYASGITPKGAIQVLNRYDASIKTTDYLLKAQAYKDAKAAYAETHEIKSLEGPGKARYNAEMTKYSFKYYKIQITLYFMAEDDTVIEQVNSKVHYSLSKPTVSEFINRLSSACEDGAEIRLISSLPKAKKSENS